METIFYVFVLLTVNVFNFENWVLGDCLNDGNACSRNGACCSGNCTFNDDQNLSYACQPLDASDDNDKIKILDFGALHEMGLKNIKEAESKAEQTKRNLISTASKLADLKKSMALLAADKLKEEVTKSVSAAAEKISLAKTVAKYKADCVEKIQNALSNGVKEATEFGAKCGLYAATRTAKLGIQIAELDKDFKTGLAKTGGKVLLECTRNSLLFSGSTAKDCAQTAVDGIYGYVVNIANQVQDIMDTSEDLVSNVVYCKENAKALAAETKDRVTEELEKCKEG